MIVTQELYDYIKLDNVAKVEEYLIQENEKEVTAAMLTKLQNLLAYAIDWKRLEIIKLFIQYSANPKMFNRFAMYYATTQTNGLPSNDIINYLREGQKGLEEDVSEC